MKVYKGWQAMNIQRSVNRRSRQPKKRTNNNYLHSQCTSDSFSTHENIPGHEPYRW